MERPDLEANAAGSGDRPAQTLWERAAQVFIEALTLPLEERQAFLNLVCGGDSDLRQEVESLLEHDLLEHDLGEGGLESVFQCAAAALIEDGSIVGQRLGPYLVKAEVGHGGMGVVYLAVRADDEYRKQVAIKVVRRGMDTTVMLERFRHERQILANLDHPYIARLLDGGSTEDDRPFFVMEFVEGQTIDEFCQQKNLGIEGICRLFLRVCEAVGYAHRNLVVHRDLKPSNILVTAEGTPKLLDFGVAKLLDSQERGSAVTGLFQRRLTPEYASPEQVRGLPVNTATDVYSLGAVLYELLTRARIHAITSSAAAEWEQAICEFEIARPSSRRQELKGDLDNILLMALRKEPERRYSSVEQFAGDVQRFLDGMPVAARHDSFRYRASKYVRRHRLGIGAAAVVAASLVIGLGLALSEARDAEAARNTAEQQRTRAEERSRQADEARAISEHEHRIAEEQRAVAIKQAGIALSEQQRAQRRLTEMVELANKSLFDIHAAIEQLPGATAARREIISTTLAYLENLEKEAGDDSGLRLALGAAYLRIGQVQGAPGTPSLGDSDGALKSYARAANWVRPLVIKMADRPVQDPKVLSVWIDIESSHAELLAEIGKQDEAVRLIRNVLPDAVTLSRLMPKDGHEAMLHKGLIGALKSHHEAEAIEEARQAADGFSRLAARDPANLDLIWDLSTVHSQWASVLHAKDPAGAMKHFRESARLREGLVNSRPDNAGYKRSLMLAYGQIAGMLGDPFNVTVEWDLAGSRTYYQKAAVIAHQLAAADPVNRIAQYDVAAVELRLGALDPAEGGEAEALASLLNARDILDNLVKGEPQVIRYQTNLSLAHEYIGVRLFATGKAAEALAEYKTSLGIAERVLSSSPKDIASLAQALASEQKIAAVLAETGDEAGAIDYAQRSVNRAEASAALGITNSQIRLAKAYGVMATVQARLRRWQPAREAAAHSRQLWQGVTGSRKEDAYADELVRAEQLVAECDSHLR